MIKTIYDGGTRVDGVTVLQNAQIVPIESKILIQTPALSGGTATKVSFLYYHNVNRYGEILTTLVAIFDPEEAQKSQYVIYDPNLFGRNSAYEESQAYIGTSYRWRNADLGSTSVEMLVDRSKYSTHTYKHYDLVTDIAQDPYASNNFMLDGWYSLLSIVLTDTPTIIEDGVLRSNSGGIEYYFDGAWHEFDGDIYTDAPIANIIRTTGSGNNYIEIAFFVTYNAVSLYDRLLTKELNGEWFTNVNKIRHKYRSISNAAESGYMDKAQILLKSMDLTLLSSKQNVRI